MEGSLSVDAWAITEHEAELTKLNSDKKELEAKPDNAAQGGLEAIDRRMAEIVTSKDNHSESHAVLKERIDVLSLKCTELKQAVRESEVR